MKQSELRKLIKEEIAQSSASELLSMLAHPDFKKQLSILNNDSVNSAYENLYATLMGIERNEPLNESPSRDAFMAGWNQSKANLGKGKIKGNIRDIDAWMEYSQGKGSEEEKDAFLDGWFKARTTTDYQDVEKQMFDLKSAGKRDTPEYDKLIKRRAELEKAKMNENTSGVDYISVKIKKDGGVLKQVKGKVEPTSIGFVIYNEKDNNTPFNIVWDRKLNKFINGESMWYEKQDVIPDLGYEEDFIKLERPFA